MFYKKKILAGSIAISLATVALNVSAHTPPVPVVLPGTVDILGDSLVNLPMNGSTVDTMSADVWFVEVPGATGYTVNLLGSGVAPIGAACIPDGAPAPDRLFDKSYILKPSDVICNVETSASKPGDGNVAGLHVCNWKTPDLPNGHYAIAINPVLSNQSNPSYQEARNPAACTANDLLGYDINEFQSDVGSTLAQLTVGGAAAGGSAVSALTNGGGYTNGAYQNFHIDLAPVAVTAKPIAPEPLHPAYGASISGLAAAAVIAAPGVNPRPAIPAVVGTLLNPQPYYLEFEDASAPHEVATWYEIYLEDKAGVRLVDFSVGDNGTYPNWHKNTVDLGLECNYPASAGGKRVCTIDIASKWSELSVGVALNDTMKWWVRGNNAMGTGPWSSLGMFRK